MPIKNTKIKTLVSFGLISLSIFTSAYAQSSIQYVNLQTGVAGAVMPGGMTFNNGPFAGATVAEFLNGDGVTAGAYIYGGHDENHFSVVTATGQIGRYGLDGNWDATSQIATTFTNGPLAGQNIMTSIANGQVFKSEVNQLWVSEADGTFYRYTASTGAGNHDSTGTAVAAGSAGSLAGMSFADIINGGHIISVDDFDNFFVIGTDGSFEFYTMGGGIALNGAPVNLSSTYQGDLDGTALSALTKNGYMHLAAGMQPGFVFAADSNRGWIVVPEPSSALLSLLGLAFVMLKRKRH